MSYTSEGTVVVCRLCGHKCLGSNGLRAHVLQGHPELKRIVGHFAFRSGCCCAPVTKYVRKWTCDACHKLCSREKVTA